MGACRHKNARWCEYFLSTYFSGLGIFQVKVCYIYPQLVKCIVKCNATLKRHKVPRILIFNFAKTTHKNMVYLTLQNLKTLDVFSTQKLAYKLWCKLNFGNFRPLTIVSFKTPTWLSLLIFPTISRRKRKTFFLTLGDSGKHWQNGT